MNAASWSMKGRSISASFWVIAAPHVPRQHLAIVERGHVADDVAGDEPQTVHVEDGEGARIGLAAAAELPGVARHQELIARHVERIEGDAEQLALALVELGVDQDPALLRSRSSIP